MVALVVKNLPANLGDVRDVDLVPGLGRSPEEGNANPLQYSCLENPMDGGAWLVTVHGIAKSWTLLSDFIIYVLNNSIFYYRISKKLFLSQR